MATREATFAKIAVAVWRLLKAKSFGDPPDRVDRLKSVRLRNSGIASTTDRVIRRFEAGQVAAADGLADFEGLTGDIQAEQGAHTELGMDENAFSILRIMEAIAPDTGHDALQAAAIAIGAVYADAAATQPAFAHMEAYLRSLRQQVRRILTEHSIGETKAIREKVEEFAIHAYGAGA